MSAKWGFRLAVVAAVAMLAIGAVMGITAAPCNPLPMSVITAFEVVRTTADVQQILGQPGDACRVALSPQIDRLNMIDMVAYIPAYTAFFVLVAHALGRRDRALGWITILIALFCALADVIENMGMFALTAAPDAPSPWMLPLIVSTNAKWIGLGVVTTLSGVMLARRGGLGRIALVFCAAPLVSSVWTAISPQDGGPWLMHGMVAASVFLLAVAVVGSVREGGGNPAPAPA